MISRAALSTTEICLRRGWIHKNQEYVGEHAVADERAHRVAARKAPAVVMEERGGRGWPRALDHLLEHLIQQAAAGEGREPAAEQGPYGIWAAPASTAAHVRRSAMKRPMKTVLGPCRSKEVCARARCDSLR